MSWGASIFVEASRAPTPRPPAYTGKYMPPLPLAMIGAEPLLVVLVVVLVLFGGQKIPELMKNVGRGVGEMKNGIEEGKSALRETLRD